MWNAKNDVSGWDLDKDSRKRTSCTYCKDDQKCTQSSLLPCCHREGVKCTLDADMGPKVILGTDRPALRKDFPEKMALLRNILQAQGHEVYVMDPEGKEYEDISEKLGVQRKKEQENAK